MRELEAAIAWGGGENSEFTMAVTYNHVCREGGLLRLLYI